jgi:hypothetical protein
MAERFHGPAGAFAYMLFVLLYTPCVAAMGTMAREVGAKWALFVAAWTFGLAYGSAIVAYQTATLADHPLTSILWIGGVALASAGSSPPCGSAASFPAAATERSGPPVSAMIWPISGPIFATTAAPRYRQWPTISRPTPRCCVVCSTCGSARAPSAVPPRTTATAAPLAPPAASEVYEWAAEPAGRG